MFILNAMKRAYLRELHKGVDPSVGFGDMLVGFFVVVGCFVVVALGASGAI